MILIAIGSNLAGPGNLRPLETCRRAVASLGSLPNLRLHSISRWYETAPIPPSSQNKYINAVARLAVEPTTKIDPAVLLARLMTIEAAYGRVRGAPNGARTLDLDIVAMGDLIRVAPDPILPHPRAHERAFVLVPLHDVAPGWVHPVLGQTVEALIAGLPPQQIRAI